MHELTLSPPLEVVESPAAPNRLAESRALAVSRVFRGSVSVLGALGLGVAYNLVALPLLPVAAGSVVLLGGGLVQLGRAAKHLWRFGSTSSAIGLTAAGGLGLSLTLASIYGMLTFYGAPVVALLPEWVLMGLSGTMVGLAVVIVLVVLRAIVAWAQEPSDVEPPEHSSLA